MQAAADSQSSCIIASKPDGGESPLSHENAKASIHDAKSRISKETAVWRGQSTSPEKLKQEVQEALAAAFDYLASNQIILDPEEIATCTAEELVVWVERCVSRLDLHDELQRKLNA